MKPFSLYDDAPRQPSVEEFYGLLNNFNLDYKIINSSDISKKVYGRINFNARKIDLNPLHNLDGITLAHEFAHLYFENYLGITQASETEIEDYAQSFYLENKKIIDDYCKKRLDKY